jgi:hypothetical protein
MVARILSGYSIRGVLDYNETKVETGDAKLIMANRFAVEVEKLELRYKIARFERLTKLNGRAKRNTLHIMLNLDRSDKVSADKLVEIAVAYMDGIGFGEQPYLVYQHHDVSHPHIHIACTNIRSDGSRIDFHNIGKSLSETVRKKIEAEFALTPSQGRGLDKEPKINPAGIKPVKYGKKPTKQSIYNVVIPVVRSYAFASLAEFNAVLKSFNIVADRGREDSIMFQRRGLVYSILDDKGERIGIPIKASALASRPTLDRLEEKFPSNLLKKKNCKGPLRDLITEIFDQNKQVTKERFASELRNRNVDLLFRRSESGQIYGVTFVDHNTRSVFNGSDLGKAYGAKALLERFLAHSLPSEKITLVSNVESHNDRTGLNIKSEPMNKSDGKTNLLLETLFEHASAELSTIALGKKKKKKKKQQSQSIR